MENQLSRYKNYKSSGIDWLGEIPSHWGLKRVKEVAFINKRTLSEKISGDYEIKYIDIGSVTYGISGYITESMTVGAAPSRARRIIKKGDTIVSTVRTYLKAITTIESDTPNLIASTGFAVVSPNKNLHPKFSAYWLMSDLIVDRVFALSTGVSYPAVNASVIGNLFLFMPNYKEQQGITDYLDSKTSEIDKKIDLLKQKAEKYADLKKSLINETVTRGLDKSVPMKDSGVEWIGQIPSHWEVKRLKEVAGINKKTLTENTPSDYTFEYLDISGVTYGVKDYKTETVTFDSAPSRARRIVKKGDTIVSTVRTYLKAITSIDTDVSGLIVSTGFAVISPKRQVFDKYCSYWLTSNTFVDEVFALSTGVSYPATNASTIGNLFCPIPPFEEQKAIAEYLENKTTQIEKIIETIYLEIETLQELRKTLINDVVTGKIKVSTVHE